MQYYYELAAFATCFTFLICRLQLWEYLVILGEMNLNYNNPICQVHFNTVHLYAYLKHGNGAF